MIDATMVASELAQARACRLAAEAASLGIEELLWEIQRSAAIWRRLALMEAIGQAGSATRRRCYPHGISRDRHMSNQSRIIAGLFMLLGVMISPPSFAQTVEIASGETLAVGLWAMTLPDINVNACSTASDLRLDYTIISHNIAALHNNDSVVSQPSDCTTIDGGTEVQIVKAVGDAVCLRQHNQSPSECLWAKNIAIESKGAFDRDRQERKSNYNLTNQIFDREHPECKDWRTKKNLPDYCY